MKKAKKLLALFLAVIMIASCTSVAFAYNASSGVTANSDYEHYKTYPISGLSNIKKLMWTPEQGAGYVLDMLDGLLYDANLNASVNGQNVVDEWYATVKLKFKMNSIDEVFWSLYNLVTALKGNTDNLKNVLDIEVLGGLGLTTVAGWIVGALDLGNLEDLDVSMLKNQNSSNDSEKITRKSNPDLEVFYTLVNFLGCDTNSGILAKLGNSTLDLGILGGILEGIDGVGPFLTDLPGAVKDLLYPILIDEDADEAPDGWTYDKGVQDIINWLLIDGTGYTAADGGKSVLGEGTEPFLPAIANYPGGASIDARTITADRGNGEQQYTMNFYQLVSNAIAALLSGMVGDLLIDVLIDALDIDTSVNDGKGDTAIMNDTIFQTIVGAIDTLLVKQNGAPPISYEKYVPYEPAEKAIYEASDYETYPVPKITRLIHWLFDGGGLDTFIKIDYNGIQIQDSFMSLFKDIARLLPSLFPLLGIEVPEGLTYSANELSKHKTDDEHGDLFVTFNDEEVYTDRVIEDVSAAPDCTWYYVADDRLVNTTDPNGANYRNPKFIRFECEVGTAQLYGALIKILLNSFVDGCYFPEWAETISEVGAYAVASIAAQYIPQNNYFDRLDAYHYQQIGQSYSPYGATSAVEPLPYEETITITPKDPDSKPKQVVIPRAVMDIGASVGAYFLTGAFDFDGSHVFSTYPSAGQGTTPATDTNFETYLFEFLVWGAEKYLPTFTGSWNSATNRFEPIAGASSVWADEFNAAIAQGRALAAQYPATGTIGAYVNQIPAEEIADIVYPLIDDTLFSLIPGDWMPNWISDNGSKGFFNDWLLNSVINLDLQKIISLLTVNTSGELTNSVTVVLLRLIDRILGTVFGGNALLLPVVSNNAIRNVYDAPTSLTTLEGFLNNGDSFYWLLLALLRYLNLYKASLATTVFPLMSLLMDMYKSKRYYDGENIVNYIDGNLNELDYSNGNSAVSISELQTYYDSWTETVNAVAVSGKQSFTSEVTAINCAKDLGKETYDGVEIVEGIDKYYVNYPEYFTFLVDATRAAAYVDNSKVVTVRSNEGTKYYVYEKLDYQTGTATLTPEYIKAADGVTVTETIYHFSDFHRAMPIVQNGSLRTGPRGEVTYGTGYKTFEREDFSTQTVFYHNRLDNAIEDTGDFIGEYDDFTNSTLPDAYGAWMNYFIQMQLKSKGLYANNPSVPGDVYPFVAASGTTTEHKIKGTAYNKTWNFADISASTPVIAAALANAADHSNDVTLGVTETENLVKLALNSAEFDITLNADGTYDGSLQWGGLSADQKNAISTQCSSFGWSYNASTNKITRPAFALINTTINGQVNFGTYTDKNNNSTAIPVAPAGSFVMGGENADEVKNDIQTAYVEFRNQVAELAENIDSHYDDMSWRAEFCEKEICQEPVLNTANFILGITEHALYPSGSSALGRNKKFNTAGQLANVYSASTFETFSRAYDYLNDLCEAIAGGTRITQSLVTEAYSALYKAYLALRPAGQLADWTQVLMYLEQAQSILNGELGLNGDRTIGYTLDTLNPLKDVVDDALEQYNTYKDVWDVDDYQDDVDQIGMNISKRINSLAFPEAVTPSIVVNEEAVTPDEEFNITPYTKAGDSRQFGLLTGFAEGSTYNQATLLGDDVNPAKFIATGYIIDGGENRPVYSDSTQGFGTGAKIVGKSDIGERFCYYVVVYGDLNGDARIDGSDVAKLQECIITERDLAEYEFAAADVATGNDQNESDGQVTILDVDFIKKYVRRYPGYAINQKVAARVPAIAE